MEFDQKYYTYKFNYYVSFQRKVNSIDVLGMIYDLSDNCDSKLIENSKRNFSNKMTICEIIQLRELLNGTKFILTLNSLLNTTLELSLT